MKTRQMTMLGILAFLIAVLPTIALAEVALPDYKRMDVGPELREWDASPARIRGLEALTPELVSAKQAEAMAALADTPYQDCVIEAKLWLSLDNYNGVYFFTTFYLVEETATSELWVQADLSWPAEDPRPTPEITCEQAEYVLSEFDDTMYPVETSYFGVPDFHDGSSSLLEAWGYVPPGYYDNAAGRQVVLVSNVRDESYYDYTYPNYIAGFYSPTFEAYFDRNIMSIDAYDWANRLGPDSYLYEGVFAHEYQHLLHDDYDPDEVSFVNEGLSMFAEYLTGYAMGNGAYRTFEAFPENSLTAWGDQGGREIVADYGLVFLWYMYLWGQYDDAFIQHHFANPDNGISGVNSSLAHVGASEDFDEAYHNFSIATVIDSDMDDYKYGFEFHDVNLDLGNKGRNNPEAFATPGAPPWGTDYYVLGGADSLVGFEFNGLQFNPLNWTSNGDALYSGTGNLLDNWAIFEATGGGTLTFESYWDIEDFWDFGFVQVSNDGGSTWASLAEFGGYTTALHDPGAHPDIIANLPGLTGWSCYYAADPCWIPLSYDLSAYPGNILLAFRFMTDWATYYEGWYVDDVYVDATLISDGSSTDAFMSYAEALGISNDYIVTLVGKRMVKGKYEYAVETILEDDYMASIDDFRYVLDEYNHVFMLVTYAAEEGVELYADYSLEFLNGGDVPFKNKIRSR